MLVVISPAKRLDWAAQEAATTTPAFAANARELAAVAKKLKPGDLKKLMSISDDLAKLNHERFQNFETETDLRPAIYAFAGDTYTGLEAQSLSDDGLRYAQDHLRILSGLYGVLRPLDAIAPYRLEMGSRMKNAKGANLYAYWGDRLAQALNEQAQATGSAYLVNCASVEYFGAVDESSLALKVITPVFMEDKPAGPKIVSFFAKKARGAMARFIVENRITDPEGLKDFDLGGYKFAPELSTVGKPTFLRDEAAAKAA